MSLGGLIERLVEGVETVAIPISSVVSSVECKVKNIVTDIETDAKCRAIDCEANVLSDASTDEDKQAYISEDSKDEFYQEMLGRILQHENSNVRNPIDIAIELGYSEEDAIAAIAYLERNLIKERG